MSIRTSQVCLLVLMSILLAVPTMALSADEYSNEFNNPGETCVLENYFNYWTPQPNFFHSDNHKLTVPVIYRCCTSSNDCLKIIFDLQNQELMSDNYVAEVADLSFIQQNLENGNISEENYLLDSAFDVCSYFGTSKLRQEAVNLGGQTAHEIKPVLSTKVQQFVTQSLSAGKTLGVIKELNPTDLVISATCYLDQKSLKKAFEKITECKGYLHNIRNRDVVAGQVNILKNCDAEAENILKEYTQSTLSQIRHAANKVGNTIAGAVSYINSLTKNPSSSVPPLKIADTEYELAQKALSKLKEQSPYLADPQLEDTLAKYRLRIGQKQSITERGLLSSKENYLQVKNQYPSILSLFFTDLFYEPDYNLSNAENLLEQAEISINQGNEFLKQFKYNSAIKALENANTLLPPAEEEVKRELTTGRTFDKRWIFGVILIGSAFFVFKFKRHKRKETNQTSGNTSGQDL